MPTYEGIRLKILKVRRKYFAKYRKNKLVNTDFTIISNNCWGGIVYESYNIPKLSPTVGLYIMPSDYIKFIKSLEIYLSYELEFISINESKWKNYVEKNDSKVGKYPIGKLDDIEIFFLHYNSEKEALEKWNRRCKRINWDRLIYKFNDQNGCTKKEYEDFKNLDLDNKIFFTSKTWENMGNNDIYIKQFRNKKEILASYEPFGKSKHIDINSFINNL